MTHDQLRAALRLLLVTDHAALGDRDLVDVCRAAVRGGVTAVQLRLKDATDRQVVDIGRRLIASLPVPVFVNDRLDLALAIGAAGVHLGPDDLSPVLARRVAPAGFMIGASVGNPAEIARGCDADYWGIGPLRTTATKSDAGPALGLDEAARVLAQAGRRPCVLIGGVLSEDVAAARRAGFAGVAVVSGIMRATDAEAAARAYCRA